MATKLRKKRKLNIMGIEYRVRHMDTGDKGGWYCPVEKEIQIDKTVEDEETYVDHLFHEGCHGVFLHTGLHQDLSETQEHVIIDSINTFLRANFEIKLKK